MEWFNKIIAETGTETVALIAMICFFFVFLNIAFNRRAIVHGPTILTTCGIFGTFVGIAMGLANFDTSNVRDGVPELLTGLKTAFWASVFGIGGALMLKMRIYLFGSVEDDLAEQQDKGKVEDVVAALHDLQVAIAGQHKTSLLSQLQLVRQSTEANTALLKRALDETTGDMPDKQNSMLEEFAAIKATLSDVSTNFGKRPQSERTETDSEGLTTQ
jgi:hypothetical protein